MCACVPIVQITLNQTQIKCNPILISENYQLFTFYVRTYKILRGYTLIRTGHEANKTKRQQLTPFRPAHIIFDLIKNIITRYTVSKRAYILYELWRIQRKTPSAL